MRRRSMQAEEKSGLVSFVSVDLTMFELCLYTRGMEGGSGRFLMEADRHIQ